MILLTHTQLLHVPYIRAYKQTEIHSIALSALFSNLQYTGTQELFSQMVSSYLADTSGKLKVVHKGEK